MRVCSMEGLGHIIVAVQGLAYGPHLRLQRCISYILQQDTFDPNSARCIKCWRVKNGLLELTIDS
jgi:hypothetical protein